MEKALTRGERKERVNRVKVHSAGLSTGPYQWSHPFVYIYGILCANFSFRLITQMLFVHMDLYGNIKCVKDL